MSRAAALRPTARQRPLGEPDAEPFGNRAHRHHCSACGREYLHRERLCLEPFDRVAVGCLPVTARPMPAGRTVEGG